jgi:hypothetical protein
MLLKRGTPGHSLASEAEMRKDTEPLIVGRYEYGFQQFFDISFNIMVFP